MTETSANLSFPCRAIRMNGHCDCKGFEFGRRDRHYTHCACGDTAGVHGIVESKYDFDNNRELAEGEVKRPKVEKVIYTSDTPKVEGTLSTGDIRRILRENNIEVGERGRIHPDKIAKAYALAGLEYVADSTPKVSNTVKAKAVDTDSGYSISEMRNALRNAKIYVGERGRLKPEQKAKAIELLGGK